MHARKIRKGCSPAARATTKGDIQHFLFHFPFDEMYRRLFFFTLGRSVSA